MGPEHASDPESEIHDLATRQLAAYNASDLEAFCECFHEQVTVQDETGAVTLQGKSAFRMRYAALFSAFREVRATVSARLSLGPHVVEHEAWSRMNPESSERESGLVIVRYTAAEGRIRWVQFLRPSQAGEELRAGEKKAANQRPG